VGDGYTVHGVYQMLMRQEMHNFDALSEGVWHKTVPLKSFYLCVASSTQHVAYIG